MDIILIKTEHLSLNLPLQYVRESFARYGVDSDVLSLWMNVYDKSPDPSTASVYWNALGQNISTPSCVWASVLCAPFLLQHTQLCLPRTEIWPVLVDMFNHDFPTRPESKKPSRNVVFVNLSRSEVVVPSGLHFKMLLTILSTPLDEETSNALRTDVFSTWNEQRWSDLIEHLNIWRNDPNFASVLSTIVLNTKDLAPQSLVSVWTQMVCYAVESERRGIVNSVMKHLSPEILKYTADNPSLVIAPHLMKFETQAKQRGNAYKFWSVVDWVSQSAPDVLDDQDICNTSVAKACAYSWRFWVRNKTYEDNAATIKQYSTSTAGMATTQLIQNMGQLRFLNAFAQWEQELTTNAEMMDNSYEELIANTLEFLLLMNCNVDDVLKNRNFDVTNHPLASARQQRITLNQVLHSNIELAPQRERKV